MSMPTCPFCIYAQGICKKTGVKIRYSTGCSYHKPKSMTNADRIRAMTDEELARAMRGCPDSAEKCRGGECADCWLDWLTQEADE